MENRGTPYYQNPLPSPAESFTSRPFHTRIKHGGHMVHKHEYETIHELGLEPSARDMGIESAEIRRCKSCDKEMTFILKDKAWLPLFKWTPEQRIEL